MSEKEREILNRISTLPDKLQDRFLDKLQGAADAVEILAAQKEEAQSNAQSNAQADS